MMKSALICLLGMLSAAPLYAGIMPAATRMVYTEGQREKTLMLANTNAYRFPSGTRRAAGAAHYI